VDPPGQSGGGVSRKILAGDNYDGRRDDGFSAADGTGSVQFPDLWRAFERLRLTGHRLAR